MGITRSWQRDIMANCLHPKDQEQIVDRIVGGDSVLEVYRCNRCGAIRRDEISVQDDSEFTPEEQAVIDRACIAAENFSGRSVKCPKDLF